jgi:hypothetical protein
MSNAVMNPFDLRGWLRLASHVGKQRGNDEQIVMPAGYYAARQRRAIAVTWLFCNSILQGSLLSFRSFLSTE